MNGAISLVIFDCDGVLVDSEVISNDVLARSLTEQGLPTTLAQARRDYQGLLLAEIDSRARAKLGRPLSKDWLERYERDRAVVFRRELQAVPGVAETVRRIQAAGVAVALDGLRQALPVPCVPGWPSARPQAWRRVTSQSWASLLLQRGLPLNCLRPCRHG